MSMIRRNLERREAQKNAFLKKEKLEVKVSSEPSLPETAEKKKHTKTDINRMPAAELKMLAAKHGVGDADSMTGAEIKKILIEKLAL